MVWPVTPITPGMRWHAGCNRWGHNNRRWEFQMSIFRLAAAAALFAATLPALAAPVAMTHVRSFAGGHSGVAVDSVTGVSYEVQGYSGSTTLQRYGSAGQLETGSGASSASFAPGLWGTYLAAHDGSLYGRTGGAAGTSISRVDGSTVTTVAVPGMGGINGGDTFDWGGYSGVNVMNDGQHLYVVGGDASTTQWRVATYDYDLNLLSNVLFNISISGCSGGTNPGFGFAIDGRIFLGNDYCGGAISASVDAATGTVTAVDYTLTGIGAGSAYITNTSYDALSDTLYAMNLSTRGLYKIDNAAAAFGVTLSHDVPEPSGIALAGLALALAGIQRRRARG